MIGQRIGPYHVKRELGHGAFGVVYEADEEFDGRAFARVALKIIKPRDANHRASLISELATLANFRHPNIVGYRTFGELPSDTPGGLAPVYIALELAKGGTLATQYKKQSLSVRQLLELARDVADGLAFIARRGWTHRDIKPDNLLCFESENQKHWKITDLGLARPFGNSNVRHAPFGTLLYLAPEGWEGVVSPANDVWALGLCLREAATKERLWENVAPNALPHLISEESAFLELGALPLPLRAIVQGCLQPDLLQRWDAGQVAARARQELARLPKESSLSLTVSPSGRERYTRIQDALDAAPPGAHITILPGRYIENLVIKQDVHLIGRDDSTNVHNKTISIESSTGCVLTLTKGRVSLENLTICGTSPALPNTQDFPAVTVGEAQLHLKNCHLSSQTSAGVLARRQAQLTVTECAIEAATEGILAREGSRVMIEKGQIARCGGDGIRASGARIQARQVVVRDCHENGVRLGAQVAAHLLDCHMLGNAHSGVRCESTTLARIENCELRGNGYGAWEISVGAEVTRLGNRPN